MYENVARTGTRYFAKQMNCLQGLLDPRILYAEDTKSTLGTLKRQFGYDVKQVMGVTMEEARNGARFCDSNSMLGVMQAVAWTGGVSMGGRRAHIWTAVQLKDVKLYARSVHIDGVRALVPSVQITFREEKFPDLRGPRSLT